MNAIYMQLFFNKTMNDLSTVYPFDCITTHLPSREGLHSNWDITGLISHVFHSCLGKDTAPW